MRFLFLFFLCFVNCLFSTPFSNNGLINNKGVDNFYYSNKIVPIVINLKATNVTDEECRLTVNGLIKEYCNSIDCKDLDIKDISSYIMTELSKIDGKNYISSCLGFIDSEFQKYKQHISENFYTQQIQQNSFSIFKQDFPKNNDDKFVIKKTDMPSTFNDLSFIEQTEFKKQDYNKYKNLKTYNIPKFSKSKQENDKATNNTTNQNNVTSQQETGKPEDKLGDSNENSSNEYDPNSGKDPALEDYYSIFNNKPAEQNLNLEIPEAIMLVKLLIYEKFHTRNVSCDKSYISISKDDVMTCDVQINDKMYKAKFIFDDLNEYNDSRRYEDVGKGLKIIFGNKAIKDSVAYKIAIPCADYNEYIKKVINESLMEYRFQFYNTNDSCYLLYTHGE